jgi:hypothetical protein
MCAVLLSKQGFEVNLAIFGGGSTLPEMEITVMSIKARPRIEILAF